jgi:hypothetical protein
MFPAPKVGISISYAQSINLCILNLELKRSVVQTWLLFSFCCAWIVYYLFYGQHALM